MPGTNFNYQVALKEGLKSLQQGRLRQAEQSFKYLVEKFPAAEGGYRGLAKVHFEQEDRTGAVRVLRDGAAALSRSGERAGAIGLLREAVALDPRDLTVHRRLAAALALTGDGEAAVNEYARYITDLRDAGETDKAWAEASYALGQLRDIPAAASLARIASRGASSAAQAPSGADTLPRTPPAGRPTVSLDSTRGRARPADPWAAFFPTAEEATAEDDGGPGERDDGEPATGVAAAEADSSAIETAATRYLAIGDPRAAEFALEAARRYIGDGRLGAASDLLLQLIAVGVADHHAQRLLVDVIRMLGKRDVARAKCQLLAQVFRLDGRQDLAAEVEALAQAD